ncbi:MAG: hypothetical protein QM489_00985 [Candidatus Izemoplasma sp.]
MKYLDQYRPETTNRLKILRLLLLPNIGDPKHASAVPRIECINSLLRKRPDYKAPDKSIDKVAKTIIRNPEYTYAKKYVNKVESSVERGIRFDLTIKQFMKVLKIKRCYYTGVRFAGNPTDPRGLTLDRIDNKIGYTKDNTVAACHGANLLKNALFEDNQSKMQFTNKQVIGLLEKMHIKLNRK